MFAVASHLKWSVRRVMAEMDAEELTQWLVWMDAEQIGPAWDRFRHAQLCASAQNGGRYEHRERRAFTAQDFTAPDPWEVPKPQAMTKEQHMAQLAVELAYLEGAFEPASDG